MGLPSLNMLPTMVHGQANMGLPSLTMLPTMVHGQVGIPWYKHVTYYGPWQGTWDSLV